MPPKRIMYIEQKTDNRGERTLDERGPAIIIEVSFSKTGRTIYADGKTFKKTDGVYGNYFCVEDGNEYWISGVKKRGSNRLFGNAPVVDRTNEGSNESKTRKRNEAVENEPRNPVVPRNIWMESCDFARRDASHNRRVELATLVAEFLTFLILADNDAKFRLELPAFAAEIKSMFEPWEIEMSLEEVPKSKYFFFQGRLLEPASPIHHYIRRAEEWLTGHGEIT